MELARRTCSRQRPEDSGVVDACYCHGSAGNGHLFNRLFQSTSALEFKGTAVSWFERTLGFRQGKKGIGGYLAWTGDPQSSIPGGRGWVHTLASLQEQQELASLFFLQRSP